MKIVYKCICAVSILVLTFCFVLSGAKIFGVFGEDLQTEVIYAYLENPALLYEKESEEGIDLYTPLTLLPPTYFVAVLEESDDTCEYIYVSYLDITGYIKKTDIQICDYEPVTKYAAAEATMQNDGQGVNLRSRPDHTNENNIIAVLLPSASVYYYGTVEGSALYPQIGNNWYYVRFEQNGTFFYGYVYSAHIKAESISPNIIEKVQKPETSIPSDDPVITPSPPEFTSVSTTILIICLCIPAVLIMLLLFKKPASPRRKPRSFHD